jgi:uncharacterized membrane protein YciS (DUF1049 family)
MGWFKSFLGLCVVLAIVICGVIVAMSNPGMVQVKLPIWASPELRLGTLIILTLLCGVLLGVFANTWATWKLSLRNKSLQKQLDQALKRFEQLQ